MPMDRIHWHNLLQNTSTKRDISLKSPNSCTTQHNTSIMLIYYSKKYIQFMKTP